MRPTEASARRFDPGFKAAVVFLASGESTDKSRLRLRAEGERVKREAALSEKERLERRGASVSIRGRSSSAGTRHGPKPLELICLRTRPLAAGHSPADLKARPSRRSFIVHDGSCGGNSPSRVALQSLHRGPNLFRCLPTDVIKADELLHGHPTQVTQALIPCIEKGSHNYRPEPEAMCGQGCRVVEPDVRPRGPISASGARAFAEAHLLTRQEADRVRLLDRAKKRLFQRPSRAENLLTR